MALGCSVESALVKSVSPITFGAVGVIGDHEVVRRHRSQADRVGRIRLAGPVPLPFRILAARAMDEPGFLQHAEHVLHVHLAVALLGRERQLERRALHVIDEDVQVVGIDERVLGRGVEEERRMPRHELIDRRARRHHHRRRLAGAPAGAAGALPRRCDRARDSPPSRRHRARRCRCRARARWSRPRRAPGPARRPFSISRRRSGR